MRVKLLTPPYICIGIAPRLLTPPISMPEAAARTIEKAMGTPKATNNIFLYSRLLQRASIDPRKLRYYIFGIIPVEIYWYDVAQIGTVFISAEAPVKEKDTEMLGEMFVLVLKPCKKYEEGSKMLRWWHIRPKWRHPFLVKNIYCDTEKYKEVLEEYSRKKVSFEIKYR